MATSSFWARTDNQAAANADMTVAPGTATQLTFTTVDPTTGTDSGDLSLDYTGGTLDTNTWVIINGVTYDFSVVTVGTVPVTTKNANIAGQNIQGQTVVIIDVNGTHYFFFSDSTNPTLNTQSYMNSFPQGAFDLDVTNTSVAVCFARGTLIETASGPRPIENLVAGDLIQTDQGPLPARWIGSNRVSGIGLVQTPELRPVRIAAGALGPGRPTRDLVVSPNHRVVVEGAAVELAFGAPRALCAAKHLVGRPGINSETPAEGIEYFHVLFASHRIVTAEGLDSESLSHGPRARETLGPDLCDRLEAEGILSADEGRSPLPVMRRFEVLALA